MLQQVVVQRNRNSIYCSKYPRLGISENHVEVCFTAYLCTGWGIEHGRVDILKNRKNTHVSLDVCTMLGYGMTRTKSEYKMIQLCWAFHWKTLGDRIGMTEQAEQRFMGESPWTASAENMDDQRKVRIP